METMSINDLHAAAHSSADGVGHDDGRLEEENKEDHQCLALIDNYGQLQLALDQTLDALTAHASTVRAHHCNSVACSSCSALLPPPPPVSSLSGCASTPSRSLQGAAAIISS